jgi:CheY-like chemotaxis protein
MAQIRPTTARFYPGAAALAVDVLVVDDDASLRESVRDTLALTGIKTAGAANGGEALGFLANQRADLILLDLCMPVLDGWAFLRQRATRPRLSEIPVLVLSGEPHDPALRGMVEGWLVKPFGEDELIEAVTRQLLRVHHLPPATRPRRPTPTAVLRKP